MITKGSKIKLVKAMGAFTNVGEICEVTDVAEGGIITFKFGNGCSYVKHLGCMSYDEYQKYFEPVVEEKKSERVWTKWKYNIVQLNDFDGKEMNVYYSYRNNGKKIQVKFQAKGKILKAESSCHKDDKFDLNKGLELAVQRLIVKVLNEQVEKKAKEM